MRKPEDITPENITPEEMALFRREMQGITRLHDDRARARRPTPRPIPRKTLEDEQQVLRDMLSENPYLAEVETGEELVYLRPGAPQKLMRKLRRGQFSVNAELDLHGKTVAEARDALALFLKECRQHDARCVRIIHGKGLGSPGGRPKIKGQLERWLRLRDEVVAYSSARPIDGGTGAVYVLLKR